MIAVSSSSSSSTFALDIVDLVDDDSAMPDLPASAHSSSSLPNTNATANSDNPFHITPTSRHTFPSYHTMNSFLNQYAADCGFEIRCPANKNTPDQPGHAGAARCWFYLAAPIILKAEQQQQPSRELNP